MRTMPNDLLIGRKRVPLGVIGAMYESRPNVTIDISALCLKSGNAVILRGGKEAFNSNLALAKLVQQAISKAGVPEGAVQFVENTDRSLVNEMLKLNEYIDLMIPRGGEPFVKFVIQNAAMPVVAGGIGVCHTYVDRTADIKKAVAIVYNAKVQKPSVCNALDTILVHKEIAGSFLPAVAAELAKADVELHCDKASMAILKSKSGLKLKAAVSEDWGKEFLALIAAVKVVDSLDEALEHIAQIRFRPFRSHYYRRLFIRDALPQRSGCRLCLCQCQHPFYRWQSVRVGGGSRYQHPKDACPRASGIEGIDQLQMDNFREWTGETLAFSGQAISAQFCTT